MMENIKIKKCIFILISDVMRILELEHPYGSLIFLSKILLNKYKILKL